MCKGMKLQILDAACNIHFARLANQGVGLLKNCFKMLVNTLDCVSLRKKGNKTKKGMKEEELDKGDCLQPTLGKVFLEI